MNKILNQIHFKKFKYSYGIFSNKKKIVLKTPKLLVPFGVENFNSKYLINVELFDQKDNNEIYNYYNHNQKPEKYPDDQTKNVITFYEVLKQIDQFMINIPENDQMSDEIKNLVKDKFYMSCIKKKKKLNPLLRLHLKKSKYGIISEFYDKNSNNVNPNSLKKLKMVCIIEIGSMWCNKINYGITFNLKVGYVDI